MAFILAVPGTLRFGSLRLSVFGIWAAAGLVASLWLSERAARRVQLPAHAVWDAGFAAAVAAFAVSRLLLIATDVHGFLRYPLLVLSLPSLTWTGLLLTAVFVAVWLRWARLPARDVLDAWAPCGCLLAAVLAWAHWLEGTDAGMPTTLPWGVMARGQVVLGQAALGRLEPVGLFACLIAAALGGWAWSRLGRRRFRGVTAGWTLLVGGVGAFLLHFWQQPERVLGTLPLDSGQFAALAAMLGGGWLLWVGERSPVCPREAAQ